MKVSGCLSSATLGRFTATLWPLSQTNVNHFATLFFFFEIYLLLMILLFFSINQSLSKYFKLNYFNLKISFSNLQKCKSISKEKLQKKRRAVEEFRRRLWVSHVVLGRHLVDPCTRQYQIIIFYHYYQMTSRFTAATFLTF